MPDLFFGVLLGFWFLSVFQVKLVFVRRSTLMGFEISAGFSLLEWKLFGGVA